MPIEHPRNGKMLKGFLRFRRSDRLFSLQQRTSVIRLRIRNGLILTSVLHTFPVYPDKNLRKDLLRKGRTKGKKSMDGRKIRRRSGWLLSFCFRRIRNKRCPPSTFHSFVFQFIAFLLCPSIIIFYFYRIVKLHPTHKTALKCRNKSKIAITEFTCHYKVAAYVERI